MASAPDPSGWDRETLVVIVVLTLMLMAAGAIAVVSRNPEWILP